MLQLWRNQRLQLRPALPAGTRRRLRRGGERLVICRLNGLLNETFIRTYPDLTRFPDSRFYGHLIGNLVVRRQLLLCQPDVTAESAS